MIDYDYLLDTLKEAIRINSIVPHEENLGTFFAEKIRELGIEPEWHVVSEGRPNVYASAELGPSDKFLLLTGHLDTVDIAAGWQTDPFEPIIQDGKLFGLGSFDMKSGLVCALAAFKAMLEDKSLYGQLGRVGFAATVDEEAYGTGARALLQTEFGQCDGILLGEPFWGIDAKRPLPLGITGKVLYEINVTGRMAHAFHPERGINAVEDAGKIIAALPQLNIGVHPKYGAGNYSTLKINGGYTEYAVVVPEQCQIIITRLTVPGENRAIALADMEALVASLNLESNVTIRTPAPFYEPYLLDSASHFKRSFDAAYASVIGTAPHYAFSQGITDANIYVAEGNIPTLHLGPRGNGAHEAGEYVEIDTLVPVAEVYVETAKRFFR